MPITPNGKNRRTLSHEEICLPGAPPHQERTLAEAGEMTCLYLVCDTAISFSKSYGP